MADRSHGRVRSWTERQYGRRDDARDDQTAPSGPADCRERARWMSALHRVPRDIRDTERQGQAATRKSQDCGPGPGRCQAAV